jgi:hypothetical protein
MDQNPAIVRMGTVTIRGGVVFVEDDWGFQHCSCRDASRLAMLYALERIQKALSDDLVRDCPSAVRGNAADFFAE